MALVLLADWSTTLSLIFGGCCSNAITLEQITTQFPQSGSLITFFQFVLISAHGLPKHLEWVPGRGPRFKKRQIPLTPYLVQVALFYLVSLLNNAAFGYRIPMAVHIIFRSGGLVVSMLQGWLIAGKRYNLVQVLAVLLVTAGVIMTTLSASRPKQTTSASVTDGPSSLATYLTGISILTLALVLSGFLGLVQDWTYTQYGRTRSPAPTSANSGKESSVRSNTAPEEKKETWHESMFYLHFLGLPMFIPLAPSIKSQLASYHNAPAIDIPLPSPLAFLSATPSAGLTSKPHFPIPAPYIPLLLNTLTQLLCVAGVHRLTSRVSSLTVTLVLVVRKAVSLLISVLGAGLIAPGKDAAEVDARMMWTGAALVMLGTIGYSIGTSASKGKKEKRD